MTTTTVALKWLELATGVVSLFGTGTGPMHVSPELHMLPGPNGNSTNSANIYKAPRMAKETEQGLPLRSYSSKKDQ
jgi:hypothetical protein